MMMMMMMMKSVEFDERGYIVTLNFGGNLINLLVILR